MKHYIYLVPGFFGFANLGELEYFGHVRDFLVAQYRARGLDAEIRVVKTHPTASLPRRTARLVEAMVPTSRVRNAALHVIGHSSGGLDARLLLVPGVELPTTVDVERFATRVRSIVTVATPHCGTPIASFFAGLRGGQLLRLLSLSTIYTLRFGRLPIAVLLQLGAVFARLDRLAVNSVLLDELFGRLLADFSTGRRRAVHHLLDEVVADQALLLQLTPESMEVFGSLTRPRQGVRCGSVVTRARRPGVRSTLAAGLDPSAQATHAIHTAIYRLASRSSAVPKRRFTAVQSKALRRAYGRLPSAAANDGVVPTRSQVWGEVLSAVDADHLDVIGHFRDPDRDPPHVDWLTTGSGFTREEFEAVWAGVAEFLEGASSGG